MPLAPIVFFVYNRLEHTRRTVDSLTANHLAKYSDLFIYSDAPKNESTVTGVNAVRSYIKTIQGFKSVIVIEREINLGLANSIIDGVTSIVNQYKKIIVLEDDLITSPYFLTYMNDALKLYENDNRVAGIHGYSYPTKETLPYYFFLRGADCWGWATWKRSWDVFNSNGQFLLDEIKRQKLEKLFNFDNSYDYTGMLQSQIDGKNSSWAIRWYASAFLAGKYTLYPGKSLVANIGLDSTGEHCGKTDEYNTMLTNNYKPVVLIDITESKKARRAFTRFFMDIKNGNSGSLSYKVKTFIKLFIPPIIIKLFSLLKNENTHIQGERVNNAAVYFQKTNYSWDEVVKQTAGYSADNILNKCRDALLKVKNGEYPYERDSVLFTEIEIFYPLLTSLFYAASRNYNKLNIVDFGGSLGSTYFQNKDILKNAEISLNWNIVEQENFVKCGKEYFENDELNFFYSIDDIHNMDVCLLGSVLPYIESPYDIMDRIFKTQSKYVIIDRTMFLQNEDDDILSIETVTEPIYDAKYPAWFFSLNKFLTYLHNKYETIFKWDTPFSNVLTGYEAKTMGFFLRKIES